MLPPSSKRKWWERGRVHTYPTFDNKLNCAIELYYTHRDDGNLAAPEHRFSEWRHPMGPLEHWPSELVEALLREKRVTPTMLMHGDPSLLRLLECCVVLPNKCFADGGGGSAY
jgi:hypothetical protein